MFALADQQSTDKVRSYTHPLGKLCPVHCFIMPPGKCSIAWENDYYRSLVADSRQEQLTSGKRIHRFCPSESPEIHYQYISQTSDVKSDYAYLLYSRAGGPAMYWRYLRVWPQRVKGFPTSSNFEKADPKRTSIFSMFLTNASYFRLNKSTVFWQRIPCLPAPLQFCCIGLLCRNEPLAKPTTSQSYDNPVQEQPLVASKEPDAFL